MYTCNINFYLAGEKCEAFDIIKEATPLVNFEHNFIDGDKLYTDIPIADVIVINPPEMAWKSFIDDIITLNTENARLIIIANSKQASALSSILNEKDIIWKTPLEKEEIQYNFLRWQKQYKIEKDLLETRQFLRAALDNSPNMVWFKDKDGKHEIVNDSFCKIVNKTKEQIQGQRHAYIWDVEFDDPDCIASELQVMKTEKTYKTEEHVHTGEGDRILETYKSPIYNLDGTVMGTVGVGVDITDKRKYEEDILNKNKIFETIFTNVNCGIICHSLDGQDVISINKEALKILGYSSEDEMIKDGFNGCANSVADEDKKVIRDALTKIHNVGDNINVEYNVIHKDNSVRHVAGNIKLIKEGDQLYYQRFLLDCTAQKLDEQQKDKLHLEILNALSTDYKAVCYFDLDTLKGDLLKIDDPNQENFGNIFDGELELQSCIENYISNYVHEKDQDQMRKITSLDNIRLELKDKDIFGTNFRAIINGKETYCQIKIAQTGEWDKHMGIVMGLRNIDLEMHEEIEKKRLLEDALQQANNASKAKSTFLANMSHDIRTPMNAIMGFTAIAKTHLDNREKVEECLSKISTSSDHMMALINDLLDMGHIESGKLAIDEKPNNLPNILKALHNIIQTSVKQKQMKLYINTIDVIDEEIYCDGVRLNQVLLNVLSNAIKYTPNGGTINFDIAEKQGAPKGYAKFEFNIKDTGIGISEEFLPHIFKSFEREKNTTMSGVQGTGIGLAIVKSIVDNMNGTIDVTSKKGEGTEVKISLVFKVNNESKENIKIPEYNNVKALIIDDDFTICDTVSYMLSEIGLRAEWTLYGKEAILRARQASVRNDPYEVYVIDLKLPDLDGLEIIKQLREEISEDAHIIVITAYDWNDIEDEANKLGVTTFCHKPLFLSELRNCLLSFIKSSEKIEENVDNKLEDILKGHLLLVEDNELNQEIATEILEEEGFTIDVASNGKIAVEKLQSHEPGYYQLILMDIQMPEMNGYEASQAIRNFDNKELSNIPILAMTANAFEEDRQKAFQAGMNGHISKPIDVNILFKTLRQVLKDQQVEE